MTHAPKLFALEALALGALSPAGTARIERHLAHCAICRAARQAVDDYARLRDEARLDEPGDLAWEKLERALAADEASGQRPVDRQAVRALPTRGRSVAVAWPLLAVAATALIIWIGLSGQEQAAELAQHATPTPAPVVVAPPAAPAELGAIVTLVAGPVERLAQGARTPLAVGDALHEGDQVVTGEGGALHVALADGSGFALAASGSLTAASLRVGTVRLALERGAVTSEVHALAAAEQYVVAGQRYAAHVRGTRFTVHAGTVFAASVHEGRVEIMESARSVAVLEAGQSWSSAGGAPAPDDTRVYAVGLDLAGWSTLTLPADTRVAHWQFDGVAPPGRAELSMRSPVGPRTLAFIDLRGKLHEVTVDVLAEGTTLAEGVLDQALAPPKETVGTLPPEQIAEVVKQGLERLRRCYERSLRQNPRLESKPLLAIRIAPDGHVARASLAAEDLPADLEQCVLNEARGWHFPRPEGGPVSFEVPLNLRARD